MTSPKVLAACLVFAATGATYAKADAWNQEITFTFNEPVAIPGQALPAGTYVFKLLNTQADRDMVVVYDPQDKHLYGMFLTIPDYQLKPTGKAIVKFEEAPAGSPEAIKAWFYPGDNFGHEFVYPKAQARELARKTNAPVPSMPDELTANTKNPAKTMNEPSAVALNNAKITAQTPNGDEVAATSVFQGTRGAH